jgi:predicted metal-binding protein
VYVCMCDYVDSGICIREVHGICACKRAHVVAHVVVQSLQYLMSDWQTIATSNHYPHTQKDQISTHTHM